MVELNNLFKMSIISFTTPSKNQLKLRKFIVYVFETWRTNPKLGCYTAEDLRV